MVFYQLGNLNSRISNPNVSPQTSRSGPTPYANFTKPTLDIILLLAEIMGWTGPIIVVAWYLFSGLMLKFISPPFGKLIAAEQRLEGEYRASHTDLVHHAEEIACFRGNEWEKTRINNIFYVGVTLSRNS
jgi:ATP-binding cassette subfamily D (ALD) protein 3